MLTQCHGAGAASPWVRRWSHLVAAPASVLDVACGHGRHLRWFAARGHPVVGVERDEKTLESVADLAAAGHAELVHADIENGPWPLMEGARPRQFNAVVVTNYLWRPLVPVIIDSLAANGLLLYETFGAGNASVGKPSRPDFLLTRGELLRICAGLTIVAYEDGFCDNPARFVQRIAAVRAAAGPSPGDANAVTHLRYPL